MPVPSLKSESKKNYLTSSDTGIVQRLLSMVLLSIYVFSDWSPKTTTTILPVVDHLVPCWNRLMRVGIDLLLSGRRRSLCQIALTDDANYFTLRHASTPPTSRALMSIKLSWSSIRVESVLSWMRQVFKSLFGKGLGNGGDNFFRMGVGRKFPRVLCLCRRCDFRRTFWSTDWWWSATQWRSLDVSFIM